MDRDSTKYTLWLVSGDCRSSMWGGNYATEADAEAAMPLVEAEFRGQCTSDEFPWDEDATWQIQAPDDDHQASIGEH